MPTLVLYRAAIYVSPRASPAMTWNDYGVFVRDLGSAFDKAGADAGFALKGDWSAWSEPFDPESGSLSSGTTQELKGVRFTDRPYERLIVAVQVDAAGDGGTATSVSVSLYVWGNPMRIANAETMEGGTGYSAILRAGEAAFRHVRMDPNVLAVASLVPSQGVDAGSPEPVATTQPLPAASNQGPAPTIRRLGAGRQGARALIVGIEQYANVSSATAALADARAVADIIERSFGLPRKDITLLDNNPTKGTVEATVQALVSEASTTRIDTAIVYFSGHGSRANGRPFLLTQDSLLSDLPHSAVPLDWVITTLAASRVEHPVLIVDACYSGLGPRSPTLPTKGAGAVAIPRPSSPSRRVALLLAAAPDREAVLDRAGDHGVMTKCLLDNVGEGLVDDGAGTVRMNAVGEHTVRCTERHHAQGPIYLAPSVDFELAYWPE